MKVLDSLCATSRVILGFVASKWRRLRKRDRVSLVLVILSLCCLLFTSGPKNESGISDSVKDTAEEEIQSINQRQAKLCLLKMDVPSSAYVVDKLTKIDWTPFEAWYTSTVEVDVIIDLSQAKIERYKNGLIVTVPEPEIDPVTCNARAANFKLVGFETHWYRRTNMLLAMAALQAQTRMREETKKICEYNFPMREARLQAARLLHTLYANAGYPNVQVKFNSKNPDIRR